MVLYKPFNQFIPQQQSDLLNLWTKLGIPFEQKKQVHGSPLTIIGIDINPNAMTFTMPATAKHDTIVSFFSIPHKVKGVKHTLCNWQRLAGWLNWSFNIFPLLRPCLNNFYAKILGKGSSNRKIWMNNVICDNLLWAVAHLHNGSGIFLLNALDWNLSDATVMIYCDACMDRMGFWYPHSGAAYYSQVPLEVPADFIFYYEVLCVLSAFHHAANTCCTPSKIVIYTDNSNTFNLLHSLPAYNHILKSSVDIRIANDHQLQVLHVPRQNNTIADTISQLHITEAIAIQPDLHLEYFQPPQVLLGAAKK